MNRKRKNNPIFGQVFGNLSFIREESIVEGNKTKRNLFLNCSCGKEYSTTAVSSLFSGSIVSCGCRKIERAMTNLCKINSVEDRRLTALDGKTFDNLTVLSVVRETLGTRAIKYYCHCICGKLWEARSKDIQSGKTKSCGCGGFTETGLLKKEFHKQTKTRMYQSWQNMHDRCRNENSTFYYNYGGRGIQVCPEWGSFVNFYEDMSPTYSDDLTLDRIDSNGNYCRENCRWADYSTQGFNQNLRSTNTTGKTGVSWDVKTGKWLARITKDRKEMTLGFYNEFWDALCARVKAELTIYGYSKH